MKLPKTEQELYDAMKAGAVVYYMPYMGRFRPNAYYFRSDNHKRCTAVVKKLLSKDLVERYEQAPFSGDHKIRIKVLPNETPSTDHQ